MKEKNITAQRIKERRLEKGLTLEKLSALTNISKSSLERYENENMIMNTPISNFIQDELQDLINSHSKKILPCLSRLCKYERIEKDIGTSKTHDAQINKIKRALDKVINENID